MLKRLKKNYFLLVSSFLILYFFFNLLSGQRGLISYFEKKDILNDLNNQESLLISQIKDLDFKNSLLSYNLDLDYIESMIRERFLFGKKNEQIYIIQENDWMAWNKLMKSIKKVQIVGDDLYVTNLERLKKGFLNLSSNAILIKLNQIGTVSETLDVIKFAQIIGFKTIISHRSGDSEDTFIADLAVGTNSNQIKTGSLARSERVAKYNQLIRIEEELGKKARMNKIH